MRPFVVPLVVILSLTGISAALLYVLLRKDDDDDFEPVEYTARQTVIKMKIPKEFIGVLIGRGGANIRQLQDEACARATFDLCEASDDKYRELGIYGTAETAQRLETLIHEFILSQPKIETIEMVVDQKHCGRIIGRGGQSIRHITNTSHAKVILTDELDCTDKKITIKGTSDQIATARDLILNIIKEHNASMEELHDSIQNRSPRITPKFHPNGLPKPISDDPLLETLTPPGGDQNLEVFVSAYKNPGQFWVQVINENGKKMDQLLDDMTDYYNNEENQQLHKLSEEQLNEGQVVAAVFPADGKWYRAQIISVTENSEKKKVIQVFYVDYGDTNDLDESKVFELRTDFLTLRFQAIECFLAGIKPVNGKWSDDALDLFEALSHSAQWVKLLVVTKTYESRQKSPNKQWKQVPGVELFDTRENGCVNIGEELVKEGFAERTDDIDASEMEFLSLSTSENEHFRAVPELSDSGSDIDGFFIEN